MELETLKIRKKVYYDIYLMKRCKSKKKPSFVRITAKRDFYDVQF